MTKTFSRTRALSQTGPADAMIAVTPDDATDLPDGPTRALFVGGAGDVSVVDRHGNVVTLSSGDSQYHPVRVVRVRGAGTTATGIVAIY